MAWALVHCKVVTGNSAATRADLFPPCYRSKPEGSALLKSGVQPSHCPHFSPSSPPTSRGGLSPLCPFGLGHPICGSHRSLPRMSVHLCTLLLPLSPPRGIGPEPIAFLCFLPDYTCIFHTAFVVQESFCQFPVRIVPHVDVFLICSWEEVNATPSYSTILINLP